LIDNHLHSWRGVNALEARPKAQNFGIKLLGVEYMRSGRHHPKIRIRTAVRHLSSPALDGSISLKFVLQIRLQSESFDDWMNC